MVYSILAVIDSETDLLAQASDQLINVDHELEAIETIVNPSSHLQFSTTGQLPFGARLPTYENTQFAYGYTIQDTSRLPVAQQSTNIAHINRPNQRTETSHHTKFKTASHVSSLTRPLETNTDTLSSVSSHRIHSNGALLPIAPISETSIRMSVPDVPLDILLKPPKKEFIQSASQIRVLPPAPPPDFVIETKVKPLQSVDSSYLPPVFDFKTETPQILTAPANDYLPPVKESEDKPTKSSIPVNTYAPPVEENTEPSTEAPQQSNQYFPPLKGETGPASDLPQPVNEYIPPAKDEGETESDATQSVNEYIPPKRELLQSASQIKVLLPALTPDFITETKFKPLLSVNSSYLPPVFDFTTETPQILTPPPNDYLPPVKEFEDEPTKSSVPVDTYTTPVEEKSETSTETHQPPDQYLPPLEEKTELISDLPQPVNEYILPVNNKTEPKPAPPQPDSENIPPKKIEPLPTQPPPSEQYLHPLEDKSPKHEPPVNYFPKPGFPESSPPPIIPIPRLTPKPLPANLPNSETPSPPIVIKTEINDHHITSGLTENNQHPLLPIGFIEESKETPITTYYENTRLSAFGIFGIAEESQIVPVKEEPNYKPLPPISEPNGKYVTSQREKTSILPPIGIAGTYDNAVIIPVKIENPPPPLPTVAGNEISLRPLPPTGLVHIANDFGIKPITAKPPAPPPFVVLSEYEDNHIQPQKGTGPILLPAISQNNYGCLVNSECSDSQICMEGMCVNACVIAVGRCVGNAVCKTKRHTPGCVCPNMFTATTIRNEGQPKYDCRPMMMMSNQGSPDTARINGITAGRTTNFHQLSRPISDFRNPHGGIRLPTLSVLSSNGRIAHRNTGLSSFPSSSSDPCRPTPCGPNTSCQTTRNGIAQCRCLDDFVPDGNTINGCKPQCTRHDDCPDDYHCKATKCVRVCQPGACGINAECDGRNHRKICQCPQGYGGQAESRCTRNPPPARNPIPRVPIDVCRPNPCGQNAECRERGERPVCTCPIGYEGDPLVNCRRGECIEARDCPSHQTCQKLRCIDPCNIPNICGQQAECQTRQHQPICSCGRNMVGDPFHSCTRFNPQDLCRPSPCGRNTNCRVANTNDRAVCSCIDNYIGDPLTGCHPECTTDSECLSRMACSSNRCVNPCIGACGEGALCDVIQGRASCSCPQYYQGNAQSRCYPECTAHDDCPSYQACYQLQCVDPCEGACGTGAECKVENHKPICFCPKGYTGHPFESCRPFTKEDLCRDNPCGHGADCTPGFDRQGNDRPVCTCPRGFIGNPIVSCQRGECERHDDCRDHQACYAYSCQNPCYTDLGSVCGDSAECTVKNHQPVCSCPPGYDGNPLQSCSPRNSAFTVGRAK